MRKAIIVTAAAMAAVIFFVLVTLPPPAARAVGGVDSAIERRTARGAIHVHTTGSDGAGSTAEIAAAAARAGLQFVIFTDHGDGTRQPNPPAYLNGVLCIDAVEISTNQGHYLALDMPVAPYRLGGEASAVVEDVRRLGGFGIAAHPHSRKPALAWTDWQAQVDGLEWLNVDSEWRDETRSRLVRAVLDYPFRPAGALASLLDRPETLARWDQLTTQRPVVAVAGHDAHGGVGRTQEDASRRGIKGIPSYEASFRLFALRTVLDEPLSGNAVSDAEAVIAALRRGSAFTAIDAIASPALLHFHARLGPTDVAMGATIPAPGAVIYSARVLMPTGAQLILLRNGVEVASTLQPDLSFETDRSGVYRVEVRVPGAPGTPPVPWLVSNPIYSIPSLPPTTYPSPLEENRLPLAGWRVEKDARSAATLTSSDQELKMSYRLAAGAEASQFVAAVLPLPTDLPQYEALSFDLSGTPSRISVQLRFDRRGGERWIKSVYVLPQRRRVMLPLRDFVPAERGSRDRPDSRTASSLLLVVDLTNSVPGTSGELSVERASLSRLP